VSDANSSLNSLQQSLTRLHAELLTAPQVDEASRRLLREVLGDIERVLKQQQPLAQAPRSRLEELAIRFDTGHPALSASLREFVDLLGRAGL
jgi:phosphoserine phosphatase